MIKSFHQIQLLQTILQEKKASCIANKQPFRYKIKKELNQRTTIHLLSNEELYSSLYASINGVDGYPSIEVRYIDEEDYVDRKDYWDKFFENEAAFEGGTRRLENAFGRYSSLKDDSLPLIVSFYSYKGGVGRSTTLATFASCHARRTGAKVLIIDCDFEAPGFANFYGMDEQDLSAKSGVVEYLTDVSYLPNTNDVVLDNYIHTISASASKDPIGYAGDKGGEIYVMKAGNLSLETVPGCENAPNGLKTHQDHYLQGLARIDFANAKGIIGQFSKMLIHICSDERFNPDVILIDSRTGFNDIFNNIALRLSDVVLGFFGTSRQNIPGIYEFLDTATVMEHSPEIVLINSICADVTESFNDFKNIIEQYDRTTGNEMSNLQMWSIGYDPRMSKIGTPRDKGDDLLIYTDPDRYRFLDYRNGSKEDTMLEYLSKLVEQKKKSNPITNQTEPVVLPSINTTPVSKEDILAPLAYFFKNENYGHADDNNSSMADDNFLNNYFYFRNYLRDIFKKDVFIVRGYKGTGKTLIYNALQNSSFTQKLAQVYKEQGNYSFLNIVQYKKYPQLKSLNFAFNGMLPAHYWRRFWVVYIWNEIMSRYKPQHSSTLKTIAIANTENTRESMEQLMNTTDFLTVEKDLQTIDSLLKANNTKLIISFDYLDDIIAIDDWGNETNAIAILLDLCRTIPYQNIYPKVFIRTDLYNKLHGIVNKKGLENKVLSLEWSGDELFAYFFKVVYAKTKDQFINRLLQQNETDKANYILNIKRLLDTNNGQISLENTDVLRFLVNNFFGENVDWRFPNRGKSYSWFYLNLKSANDVISLRPFIALLQRAIDDAKVTTWFMIDDKQAILSGQFFARVSVRKLAAKEHFEDIIKERDKELAMFAETMIEQDSELKQFKQMTLDEHQLRLLLTKIYKLNGEYNVPREKWKKLLEKLEDAGVIRQNSSYKITYSFAFLYKFYLGLSGNPAYRS